MDTTAGGFRYFDSRRMGSTPSKHGSRYRTKAANTDHSRGCSKKSQENGQAIAVTDAKIEAIVTSLEKQEQISAQTNEQISVLVQALLKQQD